MTLEEDMKELMTEQQPKEYIRPVVKWFAGEMETKLRNHDDRHGWNDAEMVWLFHRVRDETSELNLVLQEYITHSSFSPKWSGISKDVISECADVANFCMMIADNANRSGSRIPLVSHSDFQQPAPVPDSTH